MDKDYKALIIEFYNWLESEINKPIETELEFDVLQGVQDKFMEIFPYGEGLYPDE